MRDPRYWTSGHPERRAYTDWVTEGWQRLASSPHRTADGAATVFVRAYARVRNGRTEQVGAYTRSGHAGEGGSSDVIPIAAPRRPDGRMRTGPLGPDELNMGGGGGAARRVSPPSNQPTAPQPPAAAMRGAAPAPTRSPTSVEEMRAGSVLENRTTLHTRIWRRSDGGAQGHANAEFDALRPSDIRNITIRGEPARIGRLPDGSTIIVRASRDGRHTIQIQRETSLGRIRTTDEFRY